MSNPPSKAWLQNLSDEDLAFIKRLVLSSGSLKEMAKQYGVSYPTVRLRLDRLIQKIGLLDSLNSVDAFERTLASCYAEGRMDETTYQALKRQYREQKKNP